MAATRRCALFARQFLGFVMLLQRSQWIGPSRHSGRSATTLLLALLALPLSEQDLWAGGPAQPKAVTFPADDGLVLFADYGTPTYTRGPAPLVILLHDAKQDRSVWRAWAGPLREAGFAVLAVDLRGHGESATSESRAEAARRQPALFQDMQSDLRGAYAWLADQPGVDRARFALVGYGAGAAVALQYAVADRSVDCIIAIAPLQQELGFQSTGDVRQLTGRVLYLFGHERDKPALAALHAANGDAIVREWPRGGGTEFSQAPAALRDDLIQALRKGVGEPSDEVVYGTINANIFHAAGSGWIAEIKPANLRHYSSPDEAEARGLRAARSTGPNDRPARGRNKSRR